MDDRGPQVVATAVVLICIDTLMVALRFIARRVGNKVGYWWDDWAALASLPFLIIYCGISIHWTYLGLGKHLVEVTSSPADILHILYITQPLYIVALLFAKVSAILFYFRVFNVAPWFRWSAYVTMFLTIGWAISLLCVALFQCRPIHKAWDQEVPGTCIDPFAGYTANAVPNVVTDILILLLPMPILWKLKTGWKRRVGFAFVFFLGYCTVAISLARLADLLHKGEKIFIDFTWDFTPFVIFALLEPGLGLISVCIPATFHLAQVVFRDKLSAYWSSRMRSSRVRSQGNKDEEAGGLGERQVELQKLRSKYYIRQASEDVRDVDRRESAVVGTFWNEGDDV